MIPIFDSKQIKNQFYWDAINALTWPLLLTPRLFATGDSIDAHGPVTIRHHVALSKSFAEEFRYGAPLPETHPLTRIAKDMAQEAGVSLHSVFMDEQMPSYHSASIDFTMQGNAAMYFRGNPLDVSDGERFTRAVIGHELGHVSIHNGGPGFTRLAVWTGFLYGLAGLALLPVIPAATALIGAGVLALPFLIHAQERNEEFLADAESVRLSKDADAVPHMLNTLQTLPDCTDALPAKEKRVMAYGTLASVFYRATHPTNEERIAVSRDAFCSPKPEPL